MKKFATILMVLFVCLPYTNIAANVNENTTTTISSEWIFDGEFNGDMDISSSIYYLKYTLNIHDGFKKQAIPITV